MFVADIIAFTILTIPDIIAISKKMQKIEKMHTKCQKHTKMPKMIHRF